MVESVVSPRRLPAVNTRPLSAWVLCGALVLYLAFDGGGYAMSTYGQAGIVVWWVVVVCAAWGLLPLRAPSRAALATIGSFGAFCAWTALGITWSISSARSFQDLALVTSYLGILVLAVAIHREREEAVRHTTHAIAASAVTVAGLALATRMWPGFIPSAHHLFGISGSGAARLAWPIDYWNGLAVLVVLAIPLLLSIATSANRLTTQAAAAAGIPLVVLAGALTQSRGGLIAAGAALIVWLALVPERVPKLAAGAIIAAGSAALVAAGFHRHAIRQGLTNAAEHHQAASLLIAIALVCSGVAIAQVGIGLLLRHTTPPEAISPPRHIALAATVTGIVVLVFVALVVGVPHKIDHLWTDFKNPVNTVQSASHLAATSGEGRYQYWVAGVDSAKSHVLIGSGPGTFQQDWLPRAPIDSYVVNAHNLYIETYTELGVIGLLFLALFIATAVGSGLWTVIRSSGQHRTYAAGATAALVAFFVAAIFDWFWQLPVLVAIVMSLVAAVVTPPRHSRVREASDPALTLGRTGRARRAFGVSITLIGLAALIAVAYPLSVNNDVANSQAAVDVGNGRAALRDALDAVRLEPGSGSAEIQYALVLEGQHDLIAALRAGLKSVRDEPENWSNWLIVSRLQAENGNPTASLAAYRRARSLNPTSPLFKA